MDSLATILFLSILTLFCAGLTIGLTFAPCYSSLCTEEFFPYSTRIHIAFFYSLLASIAVGLGLRTTSEAARRLSRTHLTPSVLPIIYKRISIGGLALLLWIGLLTFATTGYWHDAEQSFWSMRGTTVDWTEPMFRIAWTGITGHWCDILLGLVIIPVNRNSFIGRLFELHVDTLLFAHKVIAYGLLFFAAVHGGWYYSFVGAFAGEENGDRKDAFNIDNPTVSYPQADFWSFAVLPSGMLSWILIVIITVTALPVLRRKSYNTFYYTHVICSVLVFIGTCIHASTDFYCLLPGLLLWVFDWIWRVSYALRTEVDAQIVNAGNGWIKIELPASVRGKPVDGEKAISYPLQSYYINFPSISRTQLHAFTAARVGAGDQGPAFLLQRSAGKKQKKLDKEWTWKLAALVPETSMQRSLKAKVEGPYTPPVPELYEAKYILCIVGGTGITGALYLATWWLQHRAQEQGSSLKLVWSVRHRAMADLREVQNLRQRLDSAANASFDLQITSEQGRLDALDCVKSFLRASEETTGTKEGRAEHSVPVVGPAWVYCSGPEGLLTATESACIQAQKELRKRTGPRVMDAFDWYIARWSL